MALRPGDALDVVRGSSSAVVSWRREKDRRVKTHSWSRVAGERKDIREGRRNSLREARRTESEENERELRDRD